MCEVAAATPKETLLSIRTTEQEKAILAEAARVRHTNVSKFVLQESLEYGDRA
jgi:uncharacterized protein (DUF1778 family)